MFTTPTTLLTALVAILSLASASPSARGAQIEARGELGGIDVARACVNQNGAGWNVERIGGGPGDWKCSKDGQWRDVNMNAACADQYFPAAWASQGRGVFDWKCNN